MTYISSCGDLCDDEDIYPCVLEYLIQNCPLYAKHSEEEVQVPISFEDEIALSWEWRLKL